MRWKTKAKIQNAVSLIPSSLSYTLYYWLQRNFGGLRSVNPERKFRAGVETWNVIQDAGQDPIGKKFLEIGTGRVPNIPITYWLLGAEGTTTIDLNPYMKAELTSEVLDYMARNEAKIEEIFGSLLRRDRFEELLRFHKHSTFSLEELLALCNIDYIAPGDAAETGLEDKSIDFHTSRAVFEHIPPGILKKILEEGNRIVRPNGMFVHRIDYSDHFSHSDKSISVINFLQYSDHEWDKLAGNRYMYMNRLRHDDFLSIFQSSGHRILACAPDVDELAAELLLSGDFQLDERFKDKSTEILSISGSWFVSKYAA